MKLTLLCIGKTDEDYLRKGIDKYLQRLKHYHIHCELFVIPDLKNTKKLSEKQQQVKEGQAILKQISATDMLILMDERGKSYRSIEFAAFFEKQMLNSVQHIVLVIGGPYGFDQAVYDRANSMVSLSKMTFSHQMVRLFIVEQIYRAFTIIRGEPYHHE